MVKPSPTPEQFSANTPHQLAQVLRGYRKAAGLNQAKAAASGGLLQKTVSMLETDPVRASVESLYRLLSALNVELVLRAKTSALRAPGEW